MIGYTERLNELAKILIDRHHKPYYDWIRNVITLSVAALTSLVALQQNYVPKEPKLIWLLAMCWIALLCTILSGIFALRSEFMSHLESLRTLNTLRREKGDCNAAQELEHRGLLSNPSCGHNISVKIMQWSFVIAICSLSAFAVSNLPMLSGLR